MPQTRSDEGLIVIHTHPSRDLSPDSVHQEFGTLPLGSELKGYPALLRNHNFLRLWLAQLISMTLFNASNYATIVLINEVTGSATLVGLALLAFSIPAVILAAPAGILVDRVDRRFILWGSNALRAMISLGFVLSLIHDQQQLLPIYILTFLVSSVGQFFAPAEGTTIPLLVSQDEMVPALSLFQTTLMLSQALGFILFAPLVIQIAPTLVFGSFTLSPIAFLYVLIALLYAVSAWLTGSLPKKVFTVEHTEEHPRSTGSLPSLIMDMRQGWHFIQHDKQLLLSVIQLSFAGILMLVVSQLASLIVTQLLLLPANSLAFIFAPAGVGLVVASLVASRLLARFGSSRTILLAILAFACAVILLPLLVFFARSVQPHGWNANALLLTLVALCMFIAGAAIATMNPPAQASMQEQTPNWIKGRVLSLQLLLYNVCSIPVILGVGKLTDMFGIPVVLYVLACATIAFAVWCYRFERKHALHLHKRAKNATIPMAEDTILLEHQ